MSVRTFLAIELNDSVRKALIQFQRQADNLLLKWVSPNAIHLTVKFLGVIEEEQVFIIKQALEEVVQEMSPFALTFKGLGGFPTLQKPRIIWAGVEGDVDHLEVLVSCIESALRLVGFPQEDRPYHPHITLARVKANAREIGQKITTSEVSKQKWNFGNLTVDRLSLFQSQLTPEGAQYSCLWTLVLGSPMQSNVNE